ncbi:MAG: tol-pal system-associated acyl-CoA thioesterase [Pseudomonadota bacterium]
MSAGKEFSLNLRVYMEDTDAGGIVYYVNYLKFIERARTEYMRDLGFGKDYIFNQDLMFVVRDLKLRYAGPARLDDDLTATARIAHLGGASLVMHQSVRRGDAVLVEGEVGLACVDREGVRPRRLPAELLAALKGDEAMST